MTDPKRPCHTHPWFVRIRILFAIAQRTRWGAVSLVCVALQLAGCGSLGSVLGSAFERPSLRHERVTFENLSLSGLSLHTFWKLENPNAIALKLAHIDYRLQVQDKQVVAGAPPAGLQIPQQGSTELMFPADVKFADLAQVLSTFLTQDRASYRVSGNLGVDTPVGVVTLPLSTEGEFEVPKIPSVEFGSPTISSMSLQGATVEFPVKFKNSNAFALLIGAVRGTLRMQGATIGELATQELGALPANGASDVRLPLSVRFSELSSAAVRALQGGKASVDWDATLSSSGVDIPLVVSQLVQFNRK
jgi:LEA14-like dessication related protein